MSVMWRSVQMHRGLAKFREEMTGPVIQTAVHIDRYFYGTVGSHSSGGLYVQLREEEGPTFCELYPTGELTVHCFVCSSYRSLYRHTLLCSDVKCRPLLHTFCDSPCSRATGSECKKLQEWERLAFCFGSHRTATEVLGNI